jgi:hypothetical protein
LYGWYKPGLTAPTRAKAARAGDPGFQANPNPTNEQPATDRQRNLTADDTDITKSTLIKMPAFPSVFASFPTFFSLE